MMTNALNKATNEELIMWINEYCLEKPTDTEMTYVKWKILVAKASKLREKSLVLLNKWDVKKRDELAIKCNNEKNTENKIKILYEISKIDEIHEEHLKIEKQAEKIEKQAETVYKQIKY